MPDRRGSRFALEALFLVALAAGLTLAHLRPLEIVGGMALGWVIMAALEWAAWRGEPHYGSGLPPRYYVPRVTLPPAQPLEQVAQGYPEQRDEAPTWIASPALRAEMLGEWPHAPVSEPDPATAWVSEDTAEAEAAPVPEPEPVGVVALPPLVEPESVDENLQVAAPEGALAASIDGEVVSELEAEEVSDTVSGSDSDASPELEVVLARSVQGVARHSLDPLAEPAPRRRFGRRGEAGVPAVEVPARPSGVRVLPGRSTRQD
jgi:hypothetical protein